MVKFDLCFGVVSSIGVCLKISELIAPYPIEMTTYLSYGAWLAILLRLLLLLLRLLLILLLLCLLLTWTIWVGIFINFLLTLSSTATFHGISQFLCCYAHIVQHFQIGQCTQHNCTIAVRTSKKRVEWMGNNSSVVDNLSF